tara:strand:+ start:8804 stop:9190 length:387 start_codon:yes stop_codon:yes gene_type:complete
MARKKQGYNARLDESLGARNKGKKTQSLKSRRDESKGTEKAMGKRAYSAVSTMDKGNRKMKKAKAKRVVNLGNGGPVGGRTTSTSSSDLTPQHKRMAMGQKVPQGKSPVRMRGGGAVKKMKRVRGPRG